MLLLIVYLLYGDIATDTAGYTVLTFSAWFLVFTWLLAPFIFNPSGFEWHKIVGDWKDWNKWINSRGGIGVPADEAWESWWEEEQQHLIFTGLLGRLCEIILCSRFFIFQYGMVYRLHVVSGSKSFLVYVYSWAIIVVLLVVLKLTCSRSGKLSAGRHPKFRLFKLSLFFICIGSLICSSVFLHLTAGDIFVSLLAFAPTGWAMVQISQAMKPVLKALGLWSSVRTLSKGYEYLMGTFIFFLVAMLAWFPSVSEVQTRLLFNQAFSRGLHVSRFFSGRRKESPD